MKAYAYLRVSGRGQIEGDGFDRQLDAIEKYAAANGYTIVEVFREEGVSGTKELENRPALAELLTALEENSVKTVLIEKLDRLARDLMVQETIIADMMKYGYTLISVHEPDLCSDDPSRKLMRQIMGAFAEYERAMIVGKLRAARQRIKAKYGRCEGGHPFGHPRYPAEQPVLDEIKKLHSHGYSYHQIAVRLNTQGVPSRFGKRWQGITIRRIIFREEVAA